jgi:Fic family protein
MVMKSTGTIYHTAIGHFDSSKGDLRLLNVRAGLSGDSYVNYDKVPQLLKKLAIDLNSKINDFKSVSEINELAYLAHYQFVTIHPFADGNGRTSRLLMNYIQAFHSMPMSIVFEEDRKEYIESLINTRQEENIQIFLDFMKSQHLKFLKNEIDKFEQNRKQKNAKNKKIRLVF